MGPLKGFRVIEIGALGPGPFAAMMLADMGAEIIRVDRHSVVPDPMPTGINRELLNRGRRSIAVNLKSDGGRELLLKLAGEADAFIEGFRPGVVERLGIGPDTLLARNPRLVYGRMTGWGQDGPLARVAGHDINYISIAGALEPVGGPIGEQGAAPIPPLNPVADFGGGGMFLAFGVVCALLEREQSGKGQVLDAAMIDGSAVLMTMIHGYHARGLWESGRGGNLLDGGAHFYNVYETKDGRFVSVGALEPQFYRLLCEQTGLVVESFDTQMNTEDWPRLKGELRRIFKTRTQAEWCEIMEGTDVCFAPVLSFRDSPRHAQNVARKTYVEHHGQMQPAPAPRFSRTPPELDLPPAHPGQHTDEILTELGYSEERIGVLREDGSVA